MDRLNDLYNNLSSMTARHKFVLIFVVKILIALGLLAFLVTKINPSEMVYAFRKADLYFLLAALAMLPLNLYFQFKKWELTCNNLLDVKDKKKITNSLFAGLAGGAFTPARIGEYFGRAVGFTDKSVVQISAATFIDKIYPLFIVAFIGSVSSVLFIHSFYGVSFYITVSLFVLWFGVFYAVTYLLLKPGVIEVILRKTLNEGTRLNSILEGVNYLKRVDKKYSVRMIFLSTIFYLCYIIQFALLTAAFSGSFNVLNYVWAGNLVMFAKSLIPSVSFAELGIREGASIFFLGRMGVASAEAFNAAISLFFINVLLPSTAGLYFLFKKNNA